MNACEMLLCAKLESSCLHNQSEDYIKTIYVNRCRPPRLVAKILKKEKLIAPTTYWKDCTALRVLDEWQKSACPPLTTLGKYMKC